MSSKKNTSILLHFSVRLMRFPTINVANLICRIAGEGYRRKTDECNMPLRLFYFVPQFSLTRTVAAMEVASQARSMTMTREETNPKLSLIG